MSASEGNREVSLQFVVPPEVAGGVYASVAQVRATTWDCVITFFQPITPSDDEADVVEARAVARVVLPLGVMGALIAALQKTKELREAVEPQSAREE